MWTDNVRAEVLAIFAAYTRTRWDEQAGEAYRRELYTRRKSKGGSGAPQGRQGGLVGGKARAKKLSPERRREIARMGARAMHASRKRHKGVRT